jgi:hypothetical protein
MRDRLDDAIEKASIAKDIAKANNQKALVDVATLEVFIAAVGWVRQYEEREDKTALFEQNKPRN